MGEVETRTSTGTSDEALVSTADLGIEDLDRRLRAASNLDAEGMDRLQEELDAVEVSVRELSDDLKASFHICPNLTQRVISPQSTQEFLILLEEDASLRERVGSKLEELSSCLRRATTTLTALPSLTSRRADVASGVEPDRRRRVRNRLDALHDLQEELEEWSDSAQRGLRKIIASGVPSRLGLELDDGTGAGARPGERSPSPRAAARGSRATTSGRSGPREPGETTGRGETSAASAAPSAALPAGQLDGQEPGESTPPEDALARPPERSTTAVRAKIAAWARRSPLLGDDWTGRLEIRFEGAAPATWVRVRALWGTRRLAGDPVVASDRGSLWEIAPVQAPSGWRPGRARRTRLPGPERQGERGAADRSSSPVQCVTTFRVDTIDRRLGDDGLPGRWMPPRTGRVVWRDVVEVPTDPGGAGSETGEEAFRRALDAIGERLGDDVRDEIAGRLFTPDSDGSLHGGERRLLRLLVEIHETPLRRYGCRVPPARAEAGGAWFPVWLVGPKEALCVPRCPREWTRRATIWTGALAAAGAVFGYGLARLAGALF